MKHVLLAGALIALTSTTAHADESTVAPTSQDALSAPGDTSGSMLDEPTDDTIAAADAAGVDLEDLLAAAATVSVAKGHQVKPRTYLIDVGELAPPKPRIPVLSGRLACIRDRESHGDPNATNQRTGAAGWFQFLGSTWAGTPQGKAGLSPYDPVASTAAAEWMVQQGRITEWQVVTNGMC